MKILLTGSNINSPSYLFYKESLNKIPRHKKNIKFFFRKFDQNLLLRHYDIILFMSGTKNINFSKIKDSKCGIVDPRAANYDNFKNYNFIIANGLEEKNFFSYTKLPTFIYPVYPSVKLIKKKSIKKKTIITYHGNREHLLNMCPRITHAIRELANKYLIELLLIYDVKKKGKVGIFNNNSLGCKVIHKQYYSNCFDKYLSNTDIGLVPQFQSLKKNEIKKNIFEHISKRFFKKKYFFSLNFKETTNLGRHLVFAQSKIPIVTDYTLSSSNFINHGHNGMLAYDTDDWLKSLKYLIDNKHRSKKIGSQLYLDWKKNFSHTNLNINLLKFIDNLNES